jgi:teichoic acid transport system permease protein
MTDQSSLGEFAAEHGLTSASKTQPFFQYLKATWQRRDFVKELAHARNTQQYSDSILGRVWQLITPILNAAIYFLIFGILLGTSKGIDNFIGFLVAGVFVFDFMQTTISASANSIIKNENLIRAVHFPKLILPLAIILQELQQYVISIIVLILIILATGEPLTLMWLALPVVLLMQTFFTAGLALVLARWGARSRDVKQLLPFFTRTWRYASGVFFSIAAFTASMPSFIGSVLTLNPGAVYIDLVRDSLMASESSEPIIWIMGVVWAAVFFLIGLLYFYRGEKNYGN